MSQRPDISIIGCGKVGTAIAQLAARAGRRVAAVASRNEQAARSAAEAIGRSSAARSIAEAAGAGALVLLTVKDEAIEPLCNQLAQQGAFGRDAVVGHCCGALSSEILASARDRCGCATGSMHPLATFPDTAAAIERFPGTYCVCEGQGPALEVLEQLAADLGGQPVRIDRAGKVLYHAAAVMACNYLTALLDAATVLCQGAGIDRHTALTALKPLVAATLENATKLGPANALTGPTARGDLETVRRHIQAITKHPDTRGLQDFYRVAGQWTLQLAVRSGKLDNEAAGALRRVLEIHHPKE